MRRSGFMELAEDGADHGDAFEPNVGIARTKSCRGPRASTADMASDRDAARRDQQPRDDDEVNSTPTPRARAASAASTGTQIYTPINNVAFASTINEYDSETRQSFTPPLEDIQLRPMSPEPYSSPSDNLRSFPLPPAVPEKDPPKKKQHKSVFLNNSNSNNKNNNAEPARPGTSHDTNDVSIISTSTSFSSGRNTTSRLDWVHTAATAAADTLSAIKPPNGIVFLRSPPPTPEPMSPTNNNTNATTTTIGDRSPRVHSVRSTIRPSTANGTLRADLGSIRRGPTIRHYRFPARPSMTTTEACFVPAGDASETWEVGCWRAGVLVSMCMLQLSVVSTVASATICITSPRRPDTSPLIWTTVSGAFTASLVVLFYISVRNYRRITRKNAGAESWIEMQHRSRRALPPRPGTAAGERASDNAAAMENWRAFASDEERLRRYVEGLEHRVAALKEAQVVAGAGASEERGDPQVRSDVFVRRDAAADGGVGGNRKSTAPTERTTADFDIGGDDDSDDDDDDNDDHGGRTDGSLTPKAGDINRGLSVSRRNLLGSQGNMSEPESHNHDQDAMPVSDTKASILTELCAAVTEPYSPLSRASSGMSPQVKIDDEENLSGSVNSKSRDKLRAVLKPAKALRRRETLCPADATNGAAQNV
ncbi:hypothetical protein B0T22DRAFT_275332 [Podospora appendiculata]|uniref:Uncharacterized protein n=1 Tax=Podospora appendiculata TaxID=314037 RepID=A0AAE0X097_9PEZI|nr:hypothetical protein B0T22DRAFT_275332 [Podospora appendiculata]